MVMVPAELVPQMAAKAAQAAQVAIARPPRSCPTQEFAER